MFIWVCYFHYRISCVSAVAVDGRLTIDNVPRSSFCFNSASVIVWFDLQLILFLLDCEICLASYCNCDCFCTHIPILVIGFNGYLYYFQVALQLVFL